MASIDVGVSEKRSVNRDLPLIPFIDFLLCLISFLLVTAVWSSMARIEANARVPGLAAPTAPEARPKTLHVRVGERRFDLEWRRGDTLLAASHVDRQPVRTARGDITYPALARQLATEWDDHGAHRSASDNIQDRAVIHSGNATPYGDLVAVMDALQEPVRVVEVAGTRERVAAFTVSFAVD